MYTNVKTLRAEYNKLIQEAIAYIGVLTGGDRVNMNLFYISEHDVTIATIDGKQIHTETEGKIARVGNSTEIQDILLSELSLETLCDIITELIRIKTQQI